MECDLRTHLTDTFNELWSPRQICGGLILPAVSVFSTQNVIKTCNFDAI